MSFWQIAVVLIIMFILIVKLLEIFGKPMSLGSQSKMSSFALILVFTLLVVRMIKEWLVR